MCEELIDKFYFSPVLPLKGASEEGSEFFMSASLTGQHTNLLAQKFLRKKERVELPQDCWCTQCV